MRTVAEIAQRLNEIRADERLQAPTANVVTNAPLALIQLEGESVIEALEWVLGTGKTCAGSFPREPR